MALVSIMAVWLAAMALGGWMLLRGGAARWQQVAQERFEAVTYLADGIDEAQARSVAQALAGLTGVAEVRLVSPSEAARELDAGAADWLQALDGENPLPWTARARLSLAAPEAFRAYEQAARGITGVAEVEWGGRAVELVLGWLRLAEAGALGALLLLAAAAAILTAGVLRLTLHARREELAIMRMVGASPAFIRWPLLLEGALQGLLGGSAAVLVLQAGLGLAAERIRSAVGLDLDAFLPVRLDVWTSAMLALFGAGLGFLGSLLAQSQALRDRP